MSICSLSYSSMLFVCFFFFFFLFLFLFIFFFQAEDGIRDLVRSRGLGDVYKRQFLFRPLPVVCSNTGIGTKKLNWFGLLLLSADR